MESIQGIVVGAEIVGRCLPSNRSLEHPAQSRPIHDAALNTKTNNATRELIHHHENPMCSQRCGFASEQIAAPLGGCHNDADLATVQVDCSVFTLTVARTEGGRDANDRR